MEVFKHKWQRVPRTIRRPIVMIVGSLLILAAGLTGWLPGPGGIPLFLIGIAVLATEFEWAQRVRDRILGWLAATGHMWRRHKIVGTLIAVVAVALGLSMVWYLYNSL
jgi:hypothetical protein